MLFNAYHVVALVLRVAPWLFRLAKDTHSGLGLWENPRIEYSTELG